MAGRRTHVVRSLCLILIPGSLISAAEEVVTVRARAIPTAVANRYTVEVEFRIQPGWHTYLDVAEGSTSPKTTVELTLPDGADFAGPWTRPTGLPDVKQPGNVLLKGAATFSREVNAAAGGTIGVKVRYQACDAEKCLRPKTVRTEAVLPRRPRSLFAAPEMLFVNDAPLNTAARQMYPSPAMYDVDNDGQTELIVGDIFGRLNVYENTQQGKGDPVWAPHVPLASADGEPIRVSNW